MYRGMGDVTPPDYSTFTMPQPTFQDVLTNAQGAPAFAVAGSPIDALLTPAPGMTQAQANANVLSILAPASAPAVPTPTSYVSTVPAPSPAGPSLSQEIDAWLATGNNKLYLGAGAALLLVVAVAKKRRR